MSKDETEIIEATEEETCRYPMTPDSFKHLIGVKELYEKNGLFKVRIISIEREKKMEDLGFQVMQGDGWGVTDGLYVSRISFNSVFDVCQVLSIGDEIIMLNDEDIRTMHAGNIIRSIYTLMSFKITVKIKTPFIKMRTTKRWKKIRAPPVSQIVDYKLMNLKINVPPVQRHVYSEENVEEKFEENEV